MRWLLVLFFSLATPIMAQTVVVKSGDHESFTRLVINFSDAAPWRIGRTDSGYELQRPLPNETYDVSGVFRLITKARVNSIWTDPLSGSLRLGVTCTCHAIPFELNPNTLVIDIHDGLPPKGSSFEQSAVNFQPFYPLGLTTNSLSKETNGAKDNYNWIEAAAEPSVDKPHQFHPENGLLQIALDSQSRGMSFRKVVTESLAKGASKGLVDIDLKGSKVSEQPNEASIANVSTSLDGAFPEKLAVSTSEDNPDRSLTEYGTECPITDNVDLGAWSTSSEGMEILILAKSGLIGEFDEVSAEKLKVAIRISLYLGFGAEARNMVKSFHSSSDQYPLLLGLSYIVDGERDPVNQFSGMQTCDNSAALWALISEPDGSKPYGVNGEAIARAFMELPEHLKFSLAQLTIDRLFLVGDNSNAEIVRASLSRAALPDADIVSMVNAKLALAEKDVERAEIELEKVSDSALASDALVARIEAHFQKRERVDERDVLLLEAFAFEEKDGSREIEFRRALAHAKALAGRFSEAFELVNGDSDLRNDIWLLLAELGQPNEVLTHAVDDAKEEGEAISGETKAEIARRLINLGLPNAAEKWLPPTLDDPELFGEIALANGDANSALRYLLSEFPSTNSEQLAQAYLATGDFNQAARVIREAGSNDEANRIERWGGGWDPDSNLAINPLNTTASDQITNAEGQTDPWARIAFLRSPVQQDESRPLEAGQKHLDESTKTRAQISEFLNVVPRLP